MPEPITIALAGIGGYGVHFVNELLDDSAGRDIHFVAAIDPSPANCRRLNDLNALKIPTYPTLDEFLSKSRADLLIICTPLHLHAAHTCAALEARSHVLCEKPLCVTLDQAAQMRSTRDRVGKVVAIGYQWSFCDAIQKLKADVMSGALGAPRRLKSLVLWPRDEAYYARNSWAGAMHDGHDNLVLDSPVNNACAHYLHNMLYVLGSQIDRSAQPATVTAELYRAHKIQNYDTAALRCVTTTGAELIFVVSHSTASKRGPIFSYEFEKATVDFSDHAGATIIAKFSDGSTKDYGSPSDGGGDKLWETVESIRTGRPVACGIEASLPHTQCVLAAQESAGEVVAFNDSMIQITGKAGHRKTAVDGLGEVLTRCYDEAKLPSELGVEWARPTKAISI